MLANSSSLSALQKKSHFKTPWLETRAGVEYATK
jgi:hypothetical protein